MAAFSYPHQFFDSTILPDGSPRSAESGHVSNGLSI